MASAAPRRGVSVVLLAALLLSGLAGLAPRSALAATTISDCSNLAAVKTTLEAGGSIVINCGVVTLDLGSEILIDSDTTIDGSGTTTISGGDSHRVIRIDGSAPGVTVTLKRLAVVDGYVTGSHPAGSGGGVYADGTSGKQVTLRLEQTTFRGNTATFGGAVYSDGFLGSATLTATSATFSGNAANLLGGAVYSYGYQGSASVTATNSTFSGNTANSGGAVFSDSTTGSASVTATNSTFSGNSAIYGGAVFSYGREGSAVLTATNSTFSGNTARYGGAVFSTGVDGNASVKATNATFDGNLATESGGAVYSDGFLGSATLTATNATFSGNAATYGGAVFSGGSSASVTLAATILAASTGGHCYNNGGATYTSTGFNLADNTDSSCNLTQPGDHVVADAGLGPLANNGGPTQTHALLAGSPAIDAAGPACLVPTDQRGFLRPQDGDGDGTSACDIGAFERGAALSGTSLLTFPAFNRVQAGDPVYVYFTVDGAEGATDILASALVGVVSCKAGGPVAGTQQAQSATPLQYQANRDRYLFIWKTNRTWYPGCRQLILTFADGGELRVNATFVRARR